MLSAYVRLFIYFSYQLNRIASKLNLAIITPDGEVSLRNIAGRGSQSRSLTGKRSYTQR